MSYRCAGFRDIRSTRRLKHLAAAAAPRRALPSTARPTIRHGHLSNRQPRKWGISGRCLHVLASGAGPRIPNVANGRRKQGRLSGTQPRRLQLTLNPTSKQANVADMTRRPHREVVRPEVSGPSEAQPAAHRSQHPAPGIARRAGSCQGGASAAEDMP